MNKGSLKLSGRLALVALGGVMLAGCAPPPQLPSPVSQSSGMNKELLSSVKTIANVTRDLRASNNVAFAPQYRGFPLDEQSVGAGHPVPLGSLKPAIGVHSLPKDNPLVGKIYTQWSGPLSPFLEHLAHKMGWAYENKLTSNGYVDPDIAIDVNHVPILSVLQQAADQSPASIKIRVVPGKIVLEHQNFSGSTQWGGD